MEGKSAIETYLIFKSNWIMDFSKILLPKNMLKKADFERFRKNIYKYFINNLSKTEETDAYQELISILKKNNIMDANLQKIIISLFKEEVIFSWGETLTKKQQNTKEFCVKLADATYIALGLDKHISPNVKEKIAYKKAIKELLEENSDTISLEMTDILNSNEKELSVIFDNAVSSNFNFVNNYNKSTVFKEIYLPISKTIDDSNTNMYKGQINYSIKEIELESKKEVFKITEKNATKNALKRIELELVAFELFQKLYEKKEEYIFIDIDSNFLMNKSNMSFVEKTLCLVKSGAILNIDYEQMLKIETLIKDLKSKGFNIAITKSKKDINFKKMYDVKYAFLKYENSISFSKALNELKNGKIEAIALNYFDNEEEVKSCNISYYLNNAQ